MIHKIDLKQALTIVLSLSTIIACLSACAGTEVAQTQAQTAPTQTQSQAPAEFGQPASPVQGLMPDQRAVLAAQAQQAKRVEITVVARVYKLLPDDTKGLPHQRFLLRLNNGTTVLIAHDTKMAPRVPINVGDLIRIHGEYIWNEKGGVIHWTHHSDNGHHEPGWIEFNGQRYQ